MNTFKGTPGPWTIAAGDATYVCKPKPMACGNRHDAALIAQAPAMLEILSRIDLATEDCDDVAQGTHYVDKGVIRCKGSFLETIEQARAILAALREGGAL